MTRRAIAISTAVLALAAAGCGGNGGGGGDAGGGDAAGGDCATAKDELRATVAERDRLFVDTQLDRAAKACAADLGEGDVRLCAQSRADLAEAAAADSPPGDLAALVDSAVAACVGTEITATLPAP